MWEVEYTEEFEAWWETLSSREQEAISRGVGQLESHGPELGRPLVDTVRQSRHAHMKELRTQAGGHPLRTFFAFDPRRMAILLIGGDKTGDKHFYQRMIPEADRLYDDHLKQLDNEGLLP
ncbi:MAG TPA: type II toxin-antitoxin system RelE/ParE family toxin [Phycisphaerae bacterium]|nr:type II toxin-antitoxin system RelE/ParE family toxin [Phycisphaerae bacterium]